MKKLLFVFAVAGLMSACASTSGTPGDSDSADSTMTDTTSYVPNNLPDNNEK